jgi:hypothetical protein
VVILYILYIVSSYNIDKKPVATGINRFFVILQILRPATEKFSGLMQPQPMVRLHPVAFGPVSVFFSVASTGPSNTNDGCKSKRSQWQNLKGWEAMGDQQAQTITLL